MVKLIFFDTETTGNEQKDFLVQIAFKHEGGSFSGLYKPEIKIPPEASAIHHITNKMVADKPTFKESTDQPIIKKLFEDKDSVVVAHNAPFDLMIVAKEDIKPHNFICTLRVARELDPEAKIPRYNLQYLRYFLELEVEATAHDALGDVLVLEKLFERLKNKIMQEGKLTEDKAVEKMVEISSHPSLFRTMNFGKHNGKKIEEVLATDRGYLEWLLQEKLDSDQIEDDWIYTLQHHLKKIGF
ncbi:MAG: Exonuclease RNase T and DNA polymerase III [Candidatus Gottesmanbacteria bacterium GW2011_GWA2_47_9]|uniref:Exonuclease RNase T and DNA polymerase III n=1 Tax=Candidatus Gottesmanbacteria bacterium GW2011_GWA2_47_9 TaxID=1618445 RepID=A0A0G1TZB8_9BACT|nr:MAG: Exonuclease RNase T and DNA polymerase III [Candidatus Gottesmanbacteria bacterium GW2011_GWA2_47_9]